MRPATSPGPLSRTEISTAGSVIVCHFATPDADSHRIAACRQGVFQQIAKQLHQPEAIGANLQIDTIGITRLVEHGVAAAADRFQQVPGFPPGAGQIARRAFQLDGSGKTADFVEQAAEVVLGTLQTVQQAHRLFVVFDFELQHFAARLNALQRVAAFVGQAGDHLADARQPFGPQHPLVGIAAFGEIVPDGQHRRANRRNSRAAGHSRPASAGCRRGGRIGCSRPRVGWPAKVAASSSTTSARADGATSASRKSRPIMSSTVCPVSSRP